MPALTQLLKSVYTKYFILSNFLRECFDQMKRMMKKLSEPYNFFFSIVYFHYQKIGGKQMPGLYALCFLTIFESLNIVSLHFLYLYVFKVDIHRIHNYYGYLFFFPILSFNYVYFFSYIAATLISFIVLLKV